MSILITDDKDIEGKDTEVQTIDTVEEDKTLYGYPEQTIAKIDYTVDPPKIIFKDSWEDGLQTAIITDRTEEQDDEEETEGILLVESDEDTTESILVHEEDDVEDSIIIG